VQAFLEALAATAHEFREAAAAKGDELDSSILAYLSALETGPVSICRESIKSMRSSDIHREGLRMAIQDGNFQAAFKTENGEILTLPLLELLRDCETRWSSTYNMISRYLTSCFSKTL
jgi:hypothetical protein